MIFQIFIHSSNSSSLSSILSLPKVSFHVYQHLQITVLDVQFILSISQLSQLIFKLSHSIPQSSFVFSGLPCLNFKFSITFIDLLQQVSSIIGHSTFIDHRFLLPQMLSFKIIYNCLHLSLMLVLFRCYGSCVTDELVHQVLFEGIDVKVGVNISITIPLV